MTMSVKQPHWSKNPIVWMVIFFPLLAVVAGFYTLYLAIESDDGLVDSEYYKHGMSINETIESDEIATEKNINGLININILTGSVQVRFSNDIKDTLATELNFKLVHRTISGLDQNILLTQVDDTMLYTGTLKTLPKVGGRWRWEIKVNDWRISERFTTHDQEVIVHSFPKK